MRRLITPSVVLPAPAEQLYATHPDPALHAAVTGAPVTVSAASGTLFRAIDGQISGTTLSAIAPRLIVQSWRSTSFRDDDPDSTLILAFVPEGADGRIDPIHIDVPEQDYQGVREAWEKYYWAPWRIVMRPAFLLFCATALLAQPVKVDWGKVVSESKTTATLQVVVNPPLRRGSAIHDRTFEELRKLGADYVRYVPWLPYPKLAVAELEPPASGKTSWDFSLIDPMTVDFLKATSGHPVILNFSTIPQWMFKTDQPVPWPADPDQPVWNYTQGTELRDPSMKELAGYYARLISWYTQGGFTDELGRRRHSGYHFKVDYWEIFNEVEGEHNMTPEQYTARYDAIAGAMRKAAPNLKFVALALMTPSRGSHYFEYFLNPRNHQPGIPLDMISYHFYAVPDRDESMEVQQHTYFTQADGFLNTVGYIESIRKRLSPGTRTAVDEIGSIAAEDLIQGEPGYVFKPIANAYWNLSGATYAYVFARLAAMGIDIAGESQLVGYPTQFPSVSMVDWETGAPNARFRVLELLKNNFAPGDKLVDTSGAPRFVHAQGFVTRDGRHKLLLISKRDREIAVPLANAAGATALIVDQTTQGGPPRVETLPGETLRFPGYAVAVIALP